MKLTDKEKRILASAQLQADASFATIARETGFRAHTVRYALTRLRERKVLTPHMIVNLTRLGFTEYHVLFSLAPESHRQTTQFLAYLVASEQVTWLAPLAGDYQYIMLICARDITEVIAFFDAISERFGDIICEKAFSIRLSLTYFRRKYLYRPRQRREAITIERASSVVDLDPLDHAILAALSASPDLPWQSIARTLRLPHSTLTDRITRLRRQGVIVGFLYALSFLKYETTMFRLLIDFKGVNHTVRATLARYCTQHPYITSYTETIGSWDFEIGVELEQPDQVREIAEGIYELFGRDLHTIKVLSRFENLKWQPYPLALHAS